MVAGFAEGFDVEGWDWCGAVREGLHQGFDGDGLDVS